MTTKLKLGPLPRTEIVKISLTIPIKLHDDLERYAQLHAEASGDSRICRASSHMLDAFLRGDRDFRRLSRER